MRWAKWRPIFHAQRSTFAELMMIQIAAAVRHAITLPPKGAADSRDVQACAAARSVGAGRVVVSNAVRGRHRLHPRLPDTRSASGKQARPSSRHHGRMVAERARKRPEHEDHQRQMHHQLREREPDDGRKARDRRARCRRRVTDIREAQPFVQAGASHPGRAKVTIEGRHPITRRRPVPLSASPAPAARPPSSRCAPSRRTRCRSDCRCKRHGLRTRRNRPPGSVTRSCRRPRDGART